MKNNTGISMNKCIKNNLPNNSIKTCKKCAHYDLYSVYCRSFNIAILNTTTGKYCKNYSAKGY